ncbi:MAG TPA: sigma 54-interacting transcriptional regulator [Thermodesulfobacteriota bacterium]|nr:sigma 54-interacting transcriptional regulator [Thermodesulfobacteriota bacterium]
MEDDCRYLLEFESMISNMAVEFINLPGEEVDAHIELALRRLVEFLGFDRSTFYQATPGDAVFVGTHCWARPGFEWRVDYRVKDFPWLYRSLTEEKKPIIMRSVDDLPAEAEQDKKNLRTINLKSYVLIPLLVGGKLIGFVTFGSLQTERSFPIDIINRLLFVCTIFSGALQRRNDELRLKNALNEVKDLKDQIEADNLSLQKELRSFQGHGRIIGQSEGVQRVVQQIKRVAHTDSTVLILGETGTGKELIAWAIHEMSPRKGRNLICVNCAGLPPSIIENELFGHEKGAFTGAVAKQLGRFEVADGSSIFLDEIGDLPMDVQAKLLRVIENQRFERLGSHKTIEVNVRVIAATNKDLAKAVKNGTFREDLYYRLNVFPISVPPLRNRPDDLPLLVDNFAQEISKRFNKHIESVSRKDLESLKAYPWPGNVRELRNVVERSVILSQSKVLRIKIPDGPVTESGSTLTLKDLERNHILSVLKKTRWRVSGENGAAAILDIHPKTLFSRMKALGIEKPF